MNDVFDGYALIKKLRSKAKVQTTYQKKIKEEEMKKALEDYKEKAAQFRMQHAATNSVKSKGYVPFVQILRDMRNELPAYMQGLQLDDDVQIGMDDLMDVVADTSKQAKLNDTQLQIAKKIKEKNYETKKKDFYFATKLANRHIHKEGAQEKAIIKKWQNQLKRSLE